MTRTPQVTALTVEHVVIPSSQTYDQVVAALEARLGPVQDWAALGQVLSAAQASWEQVEQAIATRLGSSGFALFAKIDHSP